MKDKKSIQRKKAQRGQSTLEIALVLPILILFLFGVVEVGFGLRNYILVANANREAARFAARDMFSDEEIAQRLISAAGSETIDGEEVPFLRIEFPEDDEGHTINGATPNAAIIITHIRMDPEGNVAPEDVSHYSSGVYPCGDCDGVDPGLIVDDGLRVVQLDEDLEESDSKVDTGEIEARHGPSTRDITDIREAEGYTGKENHIVVVETYFMHQPFAHGLVPSPWLMYTHTEVRAIQQ